MTSCSVLWRIDNWGINLQETNRLRHTNCGQSFFLVYGSFKKLMPSRAARAEGTNGGHAIDGGSRSKVRGNRLLGSVMERAT